MAARARSREEWKELVASLAASGETTAEFASRLGVNRRTLVWWRWKLRSLAQAPDREIAAFAPVVVAPQPRPCESRLWSRPVEFDLPNGVVVRFVDGVEFDAVVALTASLGGTA